MMSPSSDKEVDKLQWPDTASQEVTLSPPGTPSCSNGQREPLPPRVSKTRQKQPKCPPTPHIDPQTKQQLLSEDWQMPNFGGFEWAQTESAAVVNVDRREASTYTHPKDFSIINAMLQGFSIQDDDGFQQVISATARDIIEGVQVSGDERQSSPSRTQKLTLEKSCATEPEDHFNPGGLDFLVNCFPTVSADDLSEILKRCEGDIQWAVNLLLDAGYEYNQPGTPSSQDHDNAVHMSQGARPKQPKPQSSQEIPSATAPLSSASMMPLAVLCQAALAPTTALASDDIQETISRSSVKRLQSIEDFQLKHSLSSSESPESKDGTRMSISSVDDPFDISSSPGAALSEVTTFTLLSENPSQQSKDKDQQSVSVGGAEAPSGDTEVLPPGESPEASTSKSKLHKQDSSMTLTLSPTLAAQLIDMFGPVGFHISQGMFAYINISHTEMGFFIIVVMSSRRHFCRCQYRYN